MTHTRYLDRKYGAIIFAKMQNARLFARIHPHVKRPEKFYYQDRSH